MLASKYRSDIDGLRAVAVLSVIIFHMNSNWLPGGFVGVDIFFVISGYLITSIIYADISKQRFSFTEFYTRRIKRILPAFFCVIFISLVVGYVILAPGDFHLLGNSAATTLVYASNMYFAKNKEGYFTGAEDFPLLHTWSLAVEEQFYFIWPITLLTLYRLFKGKNALISIMLVIATASFCLASIMSLIPALSNWSYFILPTRAGELLIGALLAVSGWRITNQRTNDALLIIGLSLIGISFFALNKSSIFPGYNALWPCIGAGLVILTGQHSPYAKVLKLKPIVFIGLLSYSLYLWHWPILVFMRYIDSSTNLNWYLLATGLTFFLSYLSWRFIEKPVRNLPFGFWKMSSLFLIIPSTLILLISLTIFFNKGLPQRFDMTTEIDSIESIGCHSKPRRLCRLNEDPNSRIISEPKVSALLLGDSHAGSMSHFFSSLESVGIQVESLSSDSCSPALSLKLLDNLKFKNNCEKQRTLTKEAILERDVILIASRWESVLFMSEENMAKGEQPNYLGDLEDYLSELSKAGKKVIIVGQVPKYQNQKILKSYLLSKRLEVFGLKFDRQIDEKYRAANQILATLAEKYKNIYFLDLEPLFCNAKDCIFIDSEGLPLYKDDDHLNIHGARYISKLMHKSEKYKWFLELFSSAK